MKLADYSQVVTADQLDVALRAGGFEGVFHYTSGSLARRLELPAVVADIRGRGWPQLAIDVPHLATVDGDGAARVATDAYGFPAGALIALDIEPDEFRADPAGWAAAADGWCEGVRARRLSPGVYGVDATVAACANRADFIWRAKPGQCDPAGPGLAADFFAGRRIVQCGAAFFAGVEMDISFSQFTIGGDMGLTPDEHTWLEGLYHGWFQLNNEIIAAMQAAQQAVSSLAQTLEGQKAILAAIAGDQKALDVDALAAALVAHLPADADAQAVAQAVAAELAKRLQPTPAGPQSTPSA